MLKSKFITLRKQLSLGYILILIILFAQSLITYQNINRGAETTSWTKHTIEVISIGHKLEKFLVDMETGQRGYLITGKKNFLKPFYDGNAGFDQKHSDALDLVSDNSAQVELLQRIKSLQLSWLEKAGKPEIALRDKVAQGSASLADVSQLLIKAEGKNIMDSLRLQLTEFIAVEQILLEKREMDNLQANDELLNQIFFGSVFAILMGVLLVYFTTRIITRPIVEINNLTKKVARGDLTQRIEYISSDEIGDLAQSINLMVNTLNDIATQADAIANGDFSIEIKQKGRNDKLGLALNEMKNQITERTQKMQQSEAQLQLANQNLILLNDIKSKISQISEIKQDEKHLQSVADKIISVLAKMTESGHAALYLVDDAAEAACLTLVGGFGVNNRDDFLTIPIGAGLVGQCAQDKASIIQTDVPTDYIQVNSALGNERPYNIMLIPVFFDRLLIAVIELASFQAFSETQRQMLVDVSENIGVILNNINNQEKTKNLLEETQRQAEELQMQQEEFKAASEGNGFQ
ncbi:MAG: CHASE3 domain-containing protein [Pseudomonadales bacterium]|nr:CHASE3 domain-containing protein [Pseudomonadales bacterium]NRA18269.1 CHASE3 domain-containing protein [Oceanospirillaceae bacterium]